MSDALQIGGHSLVLCVRSEFLTLKKAISYDTSTMLERLSTPLRSDILEATVEIIDT